MVTTIKDIFASAYENHQKNKLKIAKGLYEEVLKIDPNHFESIFLLGTLCAQSKSFEEARQLLYKATQINPNFADAHNNLGNVLKELQDNEKAMISYKKSIEVQPNFAPAHNNIGTLFLEMNERQKAISFFQKAVELQPNFIEALNNLGSVLEQSHPEKAIKYYEQAIQINPNYAETHYNFGNMLREIGEHQKAINSYEKAISLKSDHAKAYNNLLFTMLHSEKYNTNLYLSKTKNFRSSLQPVNDNLLLKYQFINKPQKLKIGFVSGDFRQHPVGYFLFDMLKHLKNKNLELIAYSNSSEKDDLSTKLKSCFANWYEISNQGDKEAINQIRKDGIHILIDLSGHSAKNRLPIFINKPAPIQVTWMGYLASTGVPEIDYIIGDPYVTPIENKNYYTEKILSMPNIWNCFSVPEFEVKINELPAIKNQYITFGCFNNLRKINDKVIILWSQILGKIPKSKIFLKNKSLDSEFIKKLIIDKFKKNKINPDSVILEGGSSRRKLLDTYNKVDIVLDPFPYSGGTTSFESTWMSTPTLTKKGLQFISKSTESINHNLGMSDWIANDENDYVLKAIKFSENIKQLSEIKKSLRNKALKSSLFDATLFAEQFKDAMWKIWNNFHEKN